MCQISKKGTLNGIWIYAYQIGGKALDGGNLKVRRGSVHVVCGEKGTGKSTLMKIINGTHAADEGEMLFEGTAVGAHTIQDTMKMGIASQIYVFANRPTRPYFFGSDFQALYQQTQALLDRLHIPYHAKQKMKELSIEGHQLIEIAKAISMDAKLVIMDEPSSAFPVLWALGAVNSCARFSGLMPIQVVKFSLTGSWCTSKTPRTEIKTDIGQIIDYGESYLKICAVMSFGLFFQITLERLLQSTGRTLHTMLIQRFGAVVNIILAPILIFGLFGFPRLEVAGAALATVIG